MPQPICPSGHKFPQPLFYQGVNICRIGS